MPFNAGSTSLACAGSGYVEIKGKRRQDVEAMERKVLRSMLLTVGNN